ncbi:hypothetical protein ACK8HX_09655 [Oryzobacter sp. R7]|uniref:hypothetical protein n=1 Tax=Oryzobacter faecalis TaxID=3388656 RepID=UPI00398CA231
MTPTPRALVAPSRPGLGAVLTLVLLGLGACGSGATAPSGSSAGTTVGSAAPSATPTEPSGRPATVVLTRTGGLAGFSDRLDIAPDGTVTGTTRSGEVSCRIDADLAAALVSGPAPTVAPAAGTDRMAVTLQRLGTTATLGEAQGPDALSTAARSLLDDVQQPEGARTICR